uniref:NADH-ubiquinone oxidoreductase chain 5 n=2 Tax=Lucanus TaxID=41108 RepID=A0A650BXR7_LUCCE|nr:NADH dehydrogenase subunit 5 [Lucanus cervus]APO08629.1 NADH dehydrogenase subunit 5 [Lucanus sp. BMNH 1425267]QDW75837.1 NADH dehydrogenase subunit 5 [Lucanus cervus]QGQ62204.1 NADH dehydrogenase subunit 5 [Lucanus cervus]UIN24725.1 NADH dehydrogenase subunit 5 [Lucanus cervus]
MNICFIYFFIFLILGGILFFMSMSFLSSMYSVMVSIELGSLNSCMIEMTLLFDWMSLLFMSFVLLISSMVIYYSNEYMEGDLFINRFIMLVMMFVMSMLLLILSPNLISILLGWDGLGLVSYCLVIYYQNVKSFNAGMLTVLTNRLGDVAFLLSISWMMNFGSWNYIYFIECMKETPEMELISLMMLFAAMTKSAQIPFSSWLPAAMAAPTPVSSLVHSSTLVTAGVYLMLRFSVSLSSSVCLILLFFSGLTMFMAGLGASYEFDLKKIIALSTLSQLGLMMSILSMGGYIIAFYHLLTHALFKALLFMCAGSMIHSLSNSQDIRSMGGLVNQMPLTCTCFIICNLSLCGLPFLSGFYSKDLILEVVSMDNVGMYIYMVYYLSTGLTVAYTARLIYYVVGGDFNFFSVHLVNDSGHYMLKGMMGLIFLVVFMGSILSWTMFIEFYMICLPLSFKMMAVLVTLLGGWIGLEVSNFVINYHLKSLKFKSGSYFFGSMWNMLYLSTFGVNYYPLTMGKKFYESVDQGWSEFYGGQNYFNYMSKSSQILQFLFKNNLKLFMVLTAMWVVFLMVVY